MVPHIQCILFDSVDTMEGLRDKLLSEQVFVSKDRHNCMAIYVLCVLKDRHAV